MDIKILHMIGQMERGGAERQLLFLAQSLQERGWQQAVVTFKPGDVWDERLIATGIPLLGVPRHQNKLWRLWQLSVVLRRECPTVLHSWSNHTNVYARWAWNNPKPRRIFSFRNNPTVDGNGMPMGRVSNAGVYTTADCVISNSHAALQYARDAGVKMRRSEVVNNIVIAHGRARPGENTAVPRIAAAGGLILLKAYDVLLQALGQLAAEGQPFELFLAGDGPERARLEKIAANLGISERVKFLGGIEDVPALLSNAHLLVHPSRSEGLSNTILEGMAEGLPVVATNVGGTPELITDGKTGLLVPPDQPALLADRIRQLLVNPSLRARLGKAGLEQVRDRCSLASITAHYEHIYRSVVSG